MPHRIANVVCQTALYEWALILTQISAAIVLASRIAAPLVSLLENVRNGARTYRCQGVRLAVSVVGHLVRNAVSPAAIPAAMLWRSVGLVAMAASPLFLMLRHSIVMTGPCERLIVPVLVVLG